MKTVLIASSLLATGAMADIALPGQNFISLRYRDQSAEALYASLNVGEVVTQAKTVRTLRATDGLFEVSCTKLENGSAPSYFCTVKTSKDGRPVSSSH